MKLQENQILQYKGTRYNSFLNGMSGICKIEKFGKRKRRMYKTRIVRILLEQPAGSGNFCVPVNCEEMDVEFALLESNEFKTFHYSMLPDSARSA
jgi:hypothetical protein